MGVEIEQRDASLWPCPVEEFCVKGPSWLIVLLSDQLKASYSSGNRGLYARSQSAADERVSQLVNVSVSPLL